MIIKKMAESSSLWLTKQRLRHLELPMKNFIENAIPHQVEILRSLKANLLKHKRLEDRNTLRQSKIKASQSIKRAQALLREMDTLRSQVADSDLQTFDNLMNPSRQNILVAINMFKNDDLEEKRSVLRPEEENLSNTNLSEDNKQQQLLLSIQSEKEKQQRMLAIECDVTNVERDINDIQVMFRDLGKLVNEQKENVNQIEMHVESTQENVEQAEQSLRKAAKLKKMSYPLIGAVIGSCVGGPLGCLAGIKVGVVATVTCFALGFTGGKVLKEKSEVNDETKDPNELLKQSVVLKSHRE
ncbi:syntaxin-17 isoform X3 [Daktulosphaira vitifoliae]|uniref:syntaxin-17 isoform X3 n=1 Tax=Daktulosphaira vitifoliae TaxID=58002 RepID=UPI0021A9BEA8|nr:syntaxin-17 isoform X3 [Daktulosphaira vitifoliae]